MNKRYGKIIAYMIYTMLVLSFISLFLYIVVDGMLSEDDKMFYGLPLEIENQSDNDIFAIVYPIMISPDYTIGKPIVKQFHYDPECKVDCENYADFAHIVIK